MENVESPSLALHMHLDGAIITIYSIDLQYPISQTYTPDRPFQSVLTLAACSTTTAVA